MHSASVAVEPTSTGQFLTARASTVHSLQSQLPQVISTSNAAVNQPAPTTVRQAQIQPLQSQLPQVVSTGNSSVDHLTTTTVRSTDVSAPNLAMRNAMWAEVREPRHAPITRQKVIDSTQQSMAPSVLPQRSKSSPHPGFVNRVDPPAVRRTSSKVSEPSSGLTELMKELHKLSAMVAQNSRAVPRAFMSFNNSAKQPDRSVCTLKLLATVS